MKANNNSPALLSLSFALLLFSCVSTPKQPLWDFEGIQRVAVMPFEIIGQSELERETAKELYRTAQYLFQRVDHFIIVDTADQADAVFRGEVIDSVREEDAYRIIISYSLKRTSDGSIVGENAMYFWSSYLTMRFQEQLSNELGVN